MSRTHQLVSKLACGLLAASLLCAGSPAAHAQGAPVVQTAGGPVLDQVRALLGSSTDRRQLLERLASVTNEAVRAAGSDVQRLASVTQQIVAALANGAPGHGDGFFVAALNSVMQAAVQASPAHANVFAQAAAQAVVGASINAAIAANPNATPAELARAENAAANSPEVTAALSAIATTVAAHAINTSGDPSAAVAIAEAVATAVNSGSALAVSQAIAAHPPGTEIVAPRVTIAVSRDSDMIRITTTATGQATVVSASTTISRGQVAVIVVDSPLGEGPAAAEVIVPNLDQTLPIVSPSRP